MPTKMGPRAKAVADQIATSAKRDFDKHTIARLRERGIQITGSTWLPDDKGSYSNGSRGYLLDDNGTGKVRDYGGVLKLAGVA